MDNIEGKTATFCPCFHLVLFHSSIENLEVFGQWLLSRFSANSLEEILMEHFHKVLIIVSFVLYVCLSLYDFPVFMGHSIVSKLAMLGDFVLM